MSLKSEAQFEDGGRCLLSSPACNGYDRPSDGLNKTGVLIFAGSVIAGCPCDGCGFTVTSPSNLPPLSHTPMPQALEFNVTTAEPPSIPEPLHSSSPSPSGDTKGMSATPQVHLGGHRGEPGTGRKARCMAKCLWESFSPLPIQEATSLLV